MEVQIPQEFKIGATKALIRISKNLHIDDGYDGCYNKRTEKLDIDFALDGAKRDRTFLHELLEVIKENYNLNIAHEDIDRIASGFLEFLWQLGIELGWGNITAVREDD